MQTADHCFQGVKKNNGTIVLTLSFERENGISGPSLTCMDKLLAFYTKSKLFAFHVWE